MDNFDTSHGVLFSTYAVPMIIGEIRRYLRDNNTIRVSRSMRDTAYKALTMKEKLTNENSKEPTIEQVAKEMGLPKEEVVFALEAIHDPVSLFEPCLLYTSLAQHFSATFDNIMYGLFHLNLSVIKHGFIKGMEILQRDQNWIFILLLIVTVLAIFAFCYIHNHKTKT